MAVRIPMCVSKWSRGRLCVTAAIPVLFVGALAARIRAQQPQASQAASESQWLGDEQAVAAMLSKAAGDELVDAARAFRKQHADAGRWQMLWDRLFATERKDSLRLVRELDKAEYDGVLDRSLGSSLGGTLGIASNLSLPGAGEYLSALSRLKGRCDAATQDAAGCVLMLGRRLVASGDAADTRRRVFNLVHSAGQARAVDRLAIATEQPAATIAAALAACRDNWIVSRNPDLALGARIAFEDSAMEMAECVFRRWRVLDRSLLAPFALIMLASRNQPLARDARQFLAACQLPDSFWELVPTHVAALGTDRVGDVLQVLAARHAEIPARFDSAIRASVAPWQECRDQVLADAARKICATQLGR